jgi:SAM-dependent methyltransferase
MTLDLDESVAQAMEADVRLLPLLPELLTDLWELGPSAE